MTKRQKWLQERLSMIGASEIAAIMGLSNYGTAHSVWLEKTGQAIEEENLAMRMGRFMEPFILSEFQRKIKGLGWNVTAVKRNQETFRHPKYDYFGATPDAFGTFEGQPCVIETKFANDYSAQRFGQEGSDQCPDEYVVQVAWQMLIKGVRHGFLGACLSNRDVACYHFDASEGEIGEPLRRLASLAMNAGHGFWRCVRDRIPPPLTGRDPDTEWVKKRYSYEDGSVTNVDEEFAAKCAELAAVTDALKGGEVVKAELENQIKQYMGEAAILETPIGDVTWKADKNGQRSFRASGLKIQEASHEEAVLV